jgi:hypothetical protein
VRIEASLPSFRAFFKQREEITEDTEVFGVGFMSL